LRFNCSIFSKEVYAMSVPCAPGILAAARKALTMSRIKATYPSIVERIFKRYCWMKGLQKSIDVDFTRATSVHRYCTVERVREGASG
jgi:hypothetical protein